MNGRLVGSMLLAGSLVLVNGFDGTVEESVKIENEIVIDIEESDLEDSIITEEPILDYTNNGHASHEEETDSSDVVISEEKKRIPFRSDYFKNIWCVAL